MTLSPHTIGRGQPLVAARSLMHEHRIRHLPVLRNGKLAGLVSIGDVVKNRLDEIELETTSLKAYVAGAA